jgi:hypothetical protein
MKSLQYSTHSLKEHAPKRKLVKTEGVLTAKDYEKRLDILDIMQFAQGQDIIDGSAVGRAHEALLGALKSASLEMNEDYVSYLIESGAVNTGPDVRNTLYRSILKTYTNALNKVKIGCEYFNTFGLKDDSIADNLKLKDITKKVKKFCPDLFTRDTHDLDEGIVSSFRAYSELLFSNKLNLQAPDDVLTSLVNDILIQGGKVKPGTEAGPLNDDKMKLPIRVVTVPVNDIAELTTGDSHFFSSYFGESIKGMCDANKYLSSMIDALPLKGTTPITGGESHRAGIVARPMINPNYLSEKNATMLVDYISDRVLSTHTHREEDFFDQYIMNRDTFPVTLMIYVPVPAENDDNDNEFFVAQILHLIALVDEIVEGASMFRASSAKSSVRSLNPNTVINEVDIMEYLLQAVIGELRHDVNMAGSDLSTTDANEYGKAKMLFEILLSGGIPSTDSSNPYDADRYGNTFQSRADIISYLVSGLGTIITGGGHKDALYYPRSVIQNQYKGGGIGLSFKMSQLFGGLATLNLALMQSRFLNHEGEDNAPSEVPGSFVDGSSRVYNHASSSVVLKALNFNLFNTEPNAESFLRGKIVEHFQYNENHHNQYGVDGLLRRLMPNSYYMRKDEYDIKYDKRGTQFAFVLSLIDMVCGISPISTIMCGKGPNNHLELFAEKGRLDPAIISPFQTRRIDSMYTNSEETQAVIMYLYKKLIVSSVVSINELVHANRRSIGGMETLELESVRGYYKELYSEYEAESLQSLRDVKKLGYSHEEIDVCAFTYHTLINDEDRWMLMSRISRNVDRAQKVLRSNPPEEEKVMIQDFIEHMQELREKTRGKKIAKASEAPLVSFGFEANEDIQEIFEKV